MEKQLIYFSANDQILIKAGDLFRVASNKVAYIEAHFELGENWTGYDLIRAVWKAGDVVKPAVLNSEGVCVVPAEVLIKRSNVYVNLVGSTLEGTSLIERLTTYPEFAGIVDKEALIDESDAIPVTPSQVEQFANKVKTDADRAEQAVSDAHAQVLLAEGWANQSKAWGEEQALIAKGHADDAEVSADRAEQSASQAGYMFFYIDENGDLIYQRTTNTQVDFYLQDGDLYVEAIV